MRRSLRDSFQKKLLAAFLMIGILPLVVCVLVLLNTFRAALDRGAEEAAGAQLSAMSADFHALLDSCQGVMEQISRHAVVREALGGGSSRDREVYNALFSAASPLLQDAGFSLYDAAGRLRYSTDGLGADTLSPDWGLLAAAGSGRDAVFRDTAGGDTSCLRAAQAVREEDVVLGYVVLDLSRAHFQRLLNGKYGAGSSVLVLDPFWEEVYSSEQDETLAPRLRERLLARQSLTQAGEEYSCHVQRDADTGFSLLLRQPALVAGWVLRLLYIMAGLSILLCLGLCVAVSMGFTRQLFAPIRALNGAMAAVESGDLDVRVDVPGTDEMSQLAGRFNRMTQRLKENLADSLRKQQELDDARIRMMQAQLNPHFLYNTLDTLKWMGKIHHIPEVSTISADLADILRRSISADEFQTLGQELALLERYVEIQKIRFGGKFDFCAEADPALLELPVPKLMLQPLVENAIIHGFEDGGGGQISVTALRVGEELEITVLDDGCGMSEESRKRFQEQTAPTSGHLGLYNVDAILRLHYGPHYGLRLPSMPGRGTCIRINIPIKTKEGGVC